MEKVSHEFRGSIQKLSTTVGSDLPAAVARVENLLRTLEEYLAVGPVEVASAAEPPPGASGEAGSTQSMARGVIDESATEPAPPSKPEDAAPPPSTDDQ
jgi:hypothetical protein